MSNDQRQDSSLTSVRPDTARAAAPFTPSLVEERLRKAVALRAALVLERRVDAIITGQEPERIETIGGMGSPLPGDSDNGLVAHAVEALSWLRWWEPDDATLVRVRLAGAPWKSICWRFGISRPTADRRYRYGLGVSFQYVVHPVLSEEAGVAKLRPPHHRQSATGQVAWPAGSSFTSVSTTPRVSPSR